MMLPKGRPAYENLNTSFIEFSELIEDLRRNSFTGYVEVVFWEYEGVLFMESGRIVNAAEEIEGARTIGQKAVSGVMRQAQEKNGSVSVYPLKADMVTMLVSVLKSEVVHSGLNTDFSDLGRLVATLQSEGHTGYVGITFKGARGTAMILMQSGEVLESMLSSGNEVLSGAQALSRILETASSVGAVFDVHSTAIEQALDNTAEILVGLELPQLLVVWQNLVATVERIADGHAGGGTFLGAFKDALIDSAGEYPFLDPFAGEFAYKEGEISYSGPASAEFSQALGQTLRATVDRISEGLSGIDLLAEVRDGLAPVLEQHADTVRKYGIRLTAPDLFGGD